MPGPWAPQVVREARPGATTAPLGGYTSDGYGFDGELARAVGGTAPGRERC